MIGKIKSYDEDTQTGVIKSDELYYEFHINDWSESLPPLVDLDVLFEEEGDTATMVTLIGSYPIKQEDAVKSRKTAMALAFFPLTGLFGAHRWYLGYYKIATFQIIVSILTAGAGILWPIIDGILLSTGNLHKDKQGRPLK
ncbi:MAG: NINE protein [Methyloprofundus sp.]|nr:NINE protein [Methyloprofundus sp.]